MSLELPLHDIVHAVESIVGCLSIGLISSSLRKQEIGYEVNCDNLL
jgi:hypothetical protein